MYLYIFKDLRTDRLVRARRLNSGNIEGTWTVVDGPGSRIIEENEAREFLIPVDHDSRMHMEGQHVHRIVVKH